MKLTNVEKALLLLVVFSLPQHASAYIDPGTGSMLLQGLLAGALTAGFTLKRYWRYFLGFFTKSESRNESYSKERPTDFPDDKSE